jgi:hypothetical protein
MKSFHSATRFLALALALLWGTPAVAEVATPNVTAASGSEPRLNAGGDAWEPFSNAMGVPNSSKPIRVQYLANDASVFPLGSNGGTSVQLRPRGGGPTLNCTANPLPPVLSASNGGTCTYRLVDIGLGQVDVLEVYHLGMLSGEIRLTATGLTASGFGNTVDAYDSDLALPGTPPVPAAGFPSRKPARLVLVMDKSGSMAWTAKHDDPACGAYYSPNPQCQRWEVLKRAMAQMVSVAKAYQLPTDKLGVVFFDSSASAVGSGIQDMTVGALDDVVAQINSRSPSGGTSIGNGIDLLLADMVGGSSANADFNNTILLFTDGAQNTPKFLVLDGSLKLNNTNSPIGATPVRPGAAQLRVCPFKLRLDDPADTVSSSLLNAITSESGCQGMQAPTTVDVLPSDMIQYFVQVLADTMVGDKLETLKSDKGEQAAANTGPTPPLTLSFRTSKDDLALTVLFGWDMPFQADGRPTIVLRKDGVAFNPLQDPGFQVHGGGEHVAMTLRAPFCNAAGSCVSADGEWEMQVTRTLPRGLGHWNLLVLGDNASLWSSYAVKQDPIGIGEPLQLTATFTEGGAPLAGLAPGSVRAMVSGPSLSLGNVLSAGTAKPGTSPEADAISAAGLKVKAMLEDPAQRDDLLAALALGAEQGIPLAESSPGVYTASFPATLAEGIYRVSFRVEGNTARNGDFTRVYNTDHYVQVRADAAATAQTLAHSPATSCPSGFGGGCVQLTIKPVDALGNLLGPGKTSGFSAQAFDGEIVGPVQDNLDGSYSLVIGYASADATAPTLQVDGQPIALPPAVGPDGRGMAGWPGLWWFWLLVILVLIFIVIWLRRQP